MQQTTEAPVPMTFFFGAENPLSNWHPAGFTVNGVDFKNNEQFMMYCKAKLFGDEECAAKILRAETPREHKALGRSVRGFEESKWAQKCEHYVFVGSLAKFRQNEVLGDFLVKTGNTELVEASPYDRIWGVGLSANDPRIHNKSAWLGENRLGKVQMKVREVLLRERGVEASRTAQSIDLLDKLPSEVKVDLGAIPAKVEGGSLDEMQRAVIPADRAQSAAKCSSHMKPDYSHPSHVDGSPLHQVQYLFSGQTFRGVIALAQQSMQLSIAMRNTGLGLAEQETATRFQRREPNLRYCLCAKSTVMLNSL